MFYNLCLWIWMQNKRGKDYALLRSRLDADSIFHPPPSLPLLNCKCSQWTYQSGVNLVQKSDGAALLWLWQTFTAFSYSSFFRWTPLPPPQVEENLAKWRSSFSFFDLEHTVSSTCWWFDLFLENYLKTEQCKYDSYREFHDSRSFIFKPSKLEFASGECKGARITVSKENIEGTRQTYLITRTVALSHSQLNHSSQNAFVTEQRSTLNCVEPKVGRW